MVIDAAKGIEAQTLKLFEVCRLRDIPDHHLHQQARPRGPRSAFELLDEIADTLALDVTPIVWPLGMGVDFRGCIDVRHQRIIGRGEGNDAGSGLKLHELPERLDGDPVMGPALETLEIARSALPAFDLESFRERSSHAGHLWLCSEGRWCARTARCRGGLGAAAAPAASNAEPFAVGRRGHRLRLQGAGQHGPEPSRPHRFRAPVLGALPARHEAAPTRIGRDITVSNPMFFFAHERETADEAVAGDVIGIPNHGTLSVGDTLSEGRDIRFTGIPNFAPEIIRRVSLADAMKAKQLARGLHDLAEEGVTQVFRPVTGNGWLVGVLGPLQLDVLTARLEKEYGVPVVFEPTGYELARWLCADDAEELKQFIASQRSTVAEDRYGAPVFLVRSRWLLNRAQEDWPHIQFHSVRERR